MSTRPLVAALAVVVLSACSSSSDSDVRARAIANLRNQAGEAVGTARFTEDEDGSVTVTVNVNGFAEGNHGMHVHSVASCDASVGFGSAGAHYNPFTKEHGLENPDGAHAGDLPNLPVSAAGTGTLTYENPRILLSAGTNSVFDGDGSALVVHALPDDQVTDPQGNSGARFACGVIERD